MTDLAFGPVLSKDGTTFRLWAPGATRVDLVTDSAYPMQQSDDGWFTATLKNARAGTLYQFKIDGDVEVPDPGSLFQPKDVAGPSQVIDHASYTWQTTQWHGRPWEEAVILETHVGTFTPEGTYRAMIDKLDHLVETGITVLELMPLADFPGKRNWGYDGVLLYAPDSSYGTPDDLKALIDAAHQRGLMVFLDVVYNHFGPEGNYLPRYAPKFFSESQTPWGNAIDYRVPEVRQFAIENALHWLRDYRFDGLRLDAVHAIVELGEVSVLHDLSKAVGRLAKESGRLIHLVLENDDNRASLLDAAADPHAGKYRAQWNDDYHHAWHVFLSGENEGYYSDYKEPLSHLVRALESGFAYQGDASAHRGGEPRGEPSGHLLPAAFVNFLQNHDQIGNRALGDRLEALAEPQAIEAALAITLLAPMPPMLFMGEEWGSQVPFPFFCDFSGELADAIRQGRRKEFKAAYEKFGDDVPDPLDESTFRSAKIDWAARDQAAGKKRLEFVRTLLNIRRSEILPALKGAKFGKAHRRDDGYLFAEWTLGDGSSLILSANLSAKPLTSGAKTENARWIWGEAGDLKPWSVAVAIGAA